MERELRKEKQAMSTQTFRYLYLLALYELVTA